MGIVKPSPMYKNNRVTNSANGACDEDIENETGLQIKIDLSQEGLLNSVTGLHAQLRVANFLE